MNGDQVFVMLCFISRFDNREVTDELADAWAPLFVDTPEEDAAEAIRHHYAETRNWIMPSDILGYVKRLRTERLRRFGPLEALVTTDPEDVDAYRAELARLQHQVAAGTITVEQRRAIEGGRR